MRASTREEAVETLVSRMSQLGHLPKEAVPEVVAAAMHREELGSTAIGRGFAVPHAEHPSVVGVIGNIGYVRPGIDFNSLDGEPVRTILLLLSPPNQPGDRLRALERISRVLRVTG
ncbi:MAG TPA: PTS sugar transporter subunit IIA [Pirellulaceae bacterium]|nr:PTS sugar transporter subunit IIA [Pirellulaceae bacterium]